MKKAKIIFLMLVFTALNIAIGVYVNEHRTHHLNLSEECTQSGVDVSRKLTHSVLWNWLLH